MSPEQRQKARADTAEAECDALRELLIAARKKFDDYEMWQDEPAPFEHRSLMEKIDAKLDAQKETL